MCSRDGVNGGGEPAREPPSPCRLGPRLGPRVESGGSDTIVAAGERGEEQEEQGVEGSRRPTSSKRVSLEATFMDARMKARNSVFYTSGAQILEGNAQPVMYFLTCLLSPAHSPEPVNWDYPLVVTLW